MAIRRVAENNAFGGDAAKGGARVVLLAGASSVLASTTPPARDNRKALDVPLLLPIVPTTWPASLMP